MAKIDDGGPAFSRPAHIEYDDWKNRERVTYGSVGMSLRDWFAGQALGVLVAEFMKIDSAWHDYDDVASSAYGIADALLRARRAQSPADVQAQHLGEFGKS